MHALVDEFERIHKEFCEALLSCRAKTSKRAVHQLRKITRISEAVLRKAAEDHPDAGQLHKHIKEIKKQLKRVRRAAGSVRDLDMHCKIAAQIRDRMLQSADAGLLTQLRREYRSLDAKLTRRREQAAKHLKLILTSSELKLERLLLKILKAMHGLHSDGPGMLATAKEWVRCTPLPGKDSESLHDYRKTTKAARYLAEMDEDSAAARKLEKHLKQVQDAIGKWHDLLLLAEEAKDALGGNAAMTLAAKQACEQARMQAERKIRPNG
jgi:CHAD domain-containing protein